MSKHKCPRCDNDMSHTGEVELPKQHFHSQQLWECNNCGYGPVRRG